MLERTGDDAVKAEIVVKMGAMSLKFVGTVEITEKDADAHRAVMTRQVARGRRPGPRQRDGGVHAVDDGGGTLSTNAQITGKAASMGEGVVAGVLDALIKDFTGKLGKL